MKSSRQRIKARRVQDFAVALVAVVLLTRYAATKPTNQLENAAAPLLRSGGIVAGTMPAEDVERGFSPSLSRTNGTFFFSVPANAVEERRWRLRGASDDDACVSSASWSFPVGANSASAFRVHASGRVDAHPSAVTMAPPLASFMPLAVPLGIVPESNWTRLPVPGIESRFWHLFTPSNTLQFTWENVLHLRGAATPVSVQAELFDDGRFVYRYDLSRCGGVASSTGALTNAVVGAAFNGNAWTTNAIPANVTSTTFYPLYPSDLDDPDPDMDGIPTADEIRLHGTDPHLPDTDFDGLSDYDEIFVYETDPFDPRSLGGPGSDGLAARLAGFGPYDFPEGSTNTAYEHVFYSGSPTGAIGFPEPTENLAVLRVLVSGSGDGDLVIGDKSYPLLPPPQLRSGAGTNTLLIAVGKGIVKRLWWRRPEGLDIALDSDDFMVGSLPSLRAGWIAFPYTDASTPCIHDLDSRTVSISLINGFPDLSAIWTSSSSDVRVVNSPPASARITGKFARSGTRQVSYTVSHPDYLAGITNFTQQVRFCPQSSDDGVGEPPDETESEYQEPVPCGCNAILGKGCRCGCDLYGHEGNTMCNCGNDCACANSPEMTDDDEDAAEDEYDAAMFGELPPMEGVLHLYGDNSDAIHLDVQVGASHNCCPCWDHNRSNYVAASYCSSRINVIDASNDVFHISYSPCDVTVHGIEPSRDFKGDAVYFSTNGVLNREAKYTILGLKIETADDRPPISVYNNLSSSFGFPVTVCTNADCAPAMALHSRLLLPSGVVRVAVENATGDVQICFAGSERYGHDAEPVLDTAVASERFFPVSHWYRLVRRHDWDLTNVRVLVMASEPGPFDLVFEYAATNSGQVVHDISRQRITAVRPPLMADKDRDGVLGSSDVAAIANGEWLYFWINDDKWKGDDAFNLPLFNGRNSSTGVIDGRNDLINFLPVAVDVAAHYSAWGGNAVDYRIVPGEGHSGLRKANVSLADCGWDAIGNVQLGSVADINGNPIHSAPVAQVGGGTNLPSAFLSLSPAARSTMLVEFPEEVWGGELALEVRSKGGGILLYSSSVTLHIGKAKNMILWENLRSIAGGTGGVATRRYALDWPGSEHKPGHVVFVHGYNMEEDEETPLWAINVFKKLWWSGLDRGFVAVQWRGNEGQIIGTDITPNYYGNVQNAFATASALKSAMDAIPGPKWFVAHSLGNMLVSAAIQDCGMPYEKYFMLNAAVPMEAYDPTNGITQASHDNMTPEAWTNYTDRVRSTHWYELFPESDGRRLLTWKGRFSNVTNIVNFYSTQEEVVNNGDGDWHSITERNFVWYNQETRKGVWPLMLHEYEGGWEFNSFYDSVTNYWIGDQQVQQAYHLPPDAACNLSGVQLQQVPFFLDFYNSEMHTSSNGVIVSSNYLYRAEMLAYAIPAESYAVGANPLPGGFLMSTNSPIHVLYDNYDMATIFTYGREDLPANHATDTKKMHRNWQHSTFVQRSYKRVHQLYKAIIQHVNGMQYE